ncbi:hypothetical protein D9611_012980 [Ephemerocybe angulata]|uniref:Uncharacterized protein n=1 Tax=Ephemerocybe angulata TaxID=980116 RepID=A0A8H5FCP1_9AGAR|nr:hypothetical protein D9611_014757 [Tulosesus angulatus]KAF5331979.1 hypothetical protein D9611_009021 [Tulosesus angulatus]KAF5334784.1 hypothetical protein D9611_012980 [Tulosesus angulatus]
MDLIVHEVGDVDVELLIADAKAISRGQRWPMTKCAFFGSSCSKPFIVPAATQCTSIGKGRPMDIFFRSYVNAAIPRSSLVYNLDDYFIEVNRYPAHSLVEGPWRYAIFTSQNCNDEVNKLVRRLYKGQDLHVHGCVLVAKADHMGIVHPVHESDLSQIETMLVENLITQYQVVTVNPDMRSTEAINVF